MSHSPPVDPTIARCVCVPLSALAPIPTMASCQPPTPPGTHWSGGGRGGLRGGGGVLLSFFLVLMHAPSPAHPRNGLCFCGNTNPAVPGSVKKAARTQWMWNPHRTAVPRVGWNGVGVIQGSNSIFEVHNSPDHSEKEDMGATPKYMWAWASHFQVPATSRCCPTRVRPKI